MKSDSKNNNGLKTKKLSEVPKGEKLQYFFDYYLGTIVIVSIIAIFLMYTLFTFLKPKPNYVLSVAIFDETLDSYVVAEKENEVLELFDLDDENAKVTLDSSFYSTSKGLDKLQIYSVTGTVDVIIAPDDVFTTLAQNGYFDNVEDLIGDNEGFYSNGFKEVENGFGGGQGEVECYGVYIGDSEFYKSLGGLQENAVVGIVANSKNKEYAEIFLEYLVD